MVSELVDSKTIRLLVVEDYRLTRLSLCSVFKNVSNISLVGDVDNAERGLELVEQYLPDVVLMDLGLPGMSGIEATQRIKTRYPDIKVIIYSSHDQEREVTAALGAGANAYCVKETPTSKLVETVQAVYDGAAWLDPAIADIALKIFQQSYKPTDTTVAPEPEQIVITTVARIPSTSPQLTEREMEVLKLLVAGQSNTEIAKSLIISVHTAKTHVCNILQKLAVHDRVQAAVKAIQSGLV